MAHIKREKKDNKHSDDHSSTDTDSSSTDCSPKHDKYDQHCDVEKSECKTHCRRKCRTICVVECEKEVCFKYQWSYKTKEDQKWKPIQGEKIPKKCDDRKHHDDDDDKKHHDGKK